MPTLVTDSNGTPIPQYLRRDGTVFEGSKGSNGAFDVNIIEALPAGTNVIGSVKVTELPILPAGSNKIGTVDVVNTSILGILTDAGTGVVTTGSPNDVTVFPDINNTEANSVQVYASSTSSIVALVIEAKFGTTYYPLLTVPMPSSLAGTSLAAILSPRFNGTLPAIWRIKLITATATTPTNTAKFQYVV